MAKNDVILLDGIVDQRLAQAIPSGSRDEVFEFFVLEELLKDYDLSWDEIKTGWIDGSGDGGIDGFYVLINGRLLEDPTNFVWPKSNASIEVWLFTCKHHATFSQAPIDSLLATFQELFDLSVERAELHGTYSKDLLEARERFAAAYRRLSIGRPVLQFHVIYGSRGDSAIVGDSVSARARQLESVVTALFSSCSVEFRFIGAEELIASHRRTKRFAIDLPFLEHLATGQDSYVLLVRLRDFCAFVTDDAGHLRRYLFDSNVRDYLGASQVNEEIARSLSDPEAPDFWWLNNGVTILATSATVPGKTIQLQDIQIVNGLQTTETIFDQFQLGRVISPDRALLVKVIVSSDEQARDRIIRATNNQNAVELASLHATDKIQRDIEQILERHDWYYERRKNYYRHVGKPEGRFVTPLYLASAAISLIFRNPMRATRVRAKFMRRPAAYEAVFSARFPIEVWPALVEVFKLTDASLAKIRARGGGGERFNANWRPLVSMLSVAKRLQAFDYSLGEFASVGWTSDDLDVVEIWGVVAAHSHRQARPDGGLIRRCCEELAKRYGVVGIEGVGRRNLPADVPAASEGEPVSEEFLKRVEDTLPRQPWKGGAHREVAAQLKCPPAKVTRAIQLLIEAGRANRQENGVVYDATGKVIAVDPERVKRSVNELNAWRQPKE